MDWIRKNTFMWIAVLSAFAVQVFTWFVLYPVAGYNEASLLVAQAIFLLMSLLLLRTSGLGWSRIGLSARNFYRALVAIFCAYGLLLIILVLQRMLGGSVPLFREQVDVYAMANNWLLTGLGEELFFSGILFNTLAHGAQPHRRWTRVPLTAGIFALWHLPGYLAIGLRMGTLGPGLMVDLLIPFVSWLFFGTMYLLSGNLWLAVFAHGSTDYALLPAVVNAPVFGLIFMAAVVLAAWWIGRKTQLARQPERITTPGSLS